MARPRKFLERSIGPLQRAAEAHARHAGGDPHPQELEPADAEPTEPSAHQRRARAQRRQDGGKFA